MLNKTKLLSLCLSITGLTSCMTDSSSTYDDYKTYTYNTSTQLYYPQGYDNTNYYSDAAPTEQKVVEVPESYHVGAYHSPTPHTDVDRSWVKSQNANSYTIELADGDKPSDVAGTLQKAPKKERMAEVKYQRGGKAYYREGSQSVRSGKSIHWSMRPRGAMLGLRTTLTIRGKPCMSMPAAPGRIS